MPHTFVVHKLSTNDNSVDEYYTLNMPTVYEPGFYRQTGSFNAFFNAYTKRKFRPNWQNGILFHAESKRDWDRSVFGGKFFAKKDFKFVANFDSIWDFYKYIDYDYKRKKYGKHDESGTKRIAQ